MEVCAESSPVEHQPRAVLMEAGDSVAGLQSPRLSQQTLCHQTPQPPPYQQWLQVWVRLHCHSPGIRTAVVRCCCPPWRDQLLTRFLALPWAWLPAQLLRVLLLPFSPQLQLLLLLLQLPSQQPQRPRLQMLLTSHSTVSTRLLSERLEPDDPPHQLPGSLQWLQQACLLDQDFWMQALTAA